MKRITRSKGQVQNIKLFLEKKNQQKKEKDHIQFQNNNNNSNHSSINGQNIANQNIPIQNTDHKVKFEEQHIKKESQNTQNEKVDLAPSQIQFNNQQKTVNGSLIYSKIDEENSIQHNPMEIEVQNENLNDHQPSENNITTSFNQPLDQNNNIQQNPPLQNKQSLKSLSDMLVQKQNHEQPESGNENHETTNQQDFPQPRKKTNNNQKKEMPLGLKNGSKEKYTNSSDTQSHSEYCQPYIKEEGNTSFSSKMPDIKNSQSENKSVSVTNTLAQTQTSFITEQQRKEGYGNLAIDQPFRILKHKAIRDKNDPSSKYKVLFFKVAWQDGTKKPVYYKYESLRKYCPDILLDYYQEHAVLYDNNVQYKKEEN